MLPLWVRRTLSPTTNMGTPREGSRMVAKFLDLAVTQCLNSGISGVTLHTTVPGQVVIDSIAFPVCLIVLGIVRGQLIKVKPS